MSVHLGIAVDEGYWICSEPRGNLMCMADLSRRAHAKFGICLTLMVKNMKCAVLVESERNDNQLKKVVARPFYDNEMFWNVFQFYFARADDMRRFLTNTKYAVLEMTSYASFHTHVREIDEDGTMYVNTCAECMYAQITVLPPVVVMPPLGDTTVCAICCGGMRAGTRSTVQLPCRHVFHTECLPPSNFFDFFVLPQIFFTRMIRCPMCRFEMPLATRTFPILLGGLDDEV